MDDKKIYTIEEIKEKTLPIFTKYNISEITIFGSYARGEANENSDIDFLVVYPKGFTLFNSISLEEELKEVLNKEIDIVSKNVYTRDMNAEVSDYAILAKKVFFNTITKEGKMIYGL